jgi:hypothetical protein
VEELVEIAFVGDQPEAEMIRGLLEGEGIPSLQQQVTPSGPRLGYGLMNPGAGSYWVMVHADRVAEARALLAEALEEGEQEIPDSVNAEYLEAAEGRRGPRNYGVVGAYLRISLFGFGAMALAFGGFMLLRGLGLT